MATPFPILYFTPQMAAENQINNLEHKEADNNQSEQEKIKKKNEDSVSSLWDNFKRSNICIIGVPEGEQKVQDIGNLLEKIMKKKTSLIW